MIIESTKYNGKCSCGREHNITTEFCIIEPGCLANADTYIAKYGFSGFSAAIYDENTYKAAAEKRPKADKEIILPPKNLHADNHGVAIASAQIPENCDYLIAVGSGTIHDITRYCAYEKGIGFVSCPTAASVDGFCSSVAAMTWFGYKKTLTAVAPKIVIADLDIISKAPTFLTNSGFGDMIGKYIALADWRIANTLTNEYFCSKIYDIAINAAKDVTACAELLAKGEISAYEKLTYGLLMSGLAMQMLGNSRCASGAEHHISHLIEMQPEGLDLKSDALHGEKVGVGTLIAAEEYYRLANDKKLCLNDYTPADNTYIEKIFGQKLKDAIISENLTDVCEGITAVQIAKHWDDICGIIEEIPDTASLLSVYRALNVKSSLKDIGISEDMREKLLEYSPLVRNRITLMRLARSIR